MCVIQQKNHSRVKITAMDILQIAIKQAGGINPLAKSLGVVPSAIGNWKSRGLPKSWQIALALKYKNAIKKHKDSHECANSNVIVSTVMDGNT